jgi:hypothetical protein
LETATPKPHRISSGGVASVTAVCAAFRMVLPCVCVAACQRRCGFGRDGQLRLPRFDLQCSVENYSTSSDPLELLA